MQAQSARTAPPVALSPAVLAQACATATPLPYVVAATFSIGNQRCLTVAVEWAANSLGLAAEDLVPEGAQLLRGEVFPAARLADMALSQRKQYRPHYSAYLLDRRARQLGVERADLRPWVDFDPIATEASVNAWAGSRNSLGG